MAVANRTLPSANKCIKILRERQPFAVKAERVGLNREETEQLGVLSIDHRKKLGNELFTLLTGKHTHAVSKLLNNDESWVIKDACHEFANHLLRIQERETSDYRIVRDWWKKFVASVDRLVGEK